MVNKDVRKVRFWVGVRRGKKGYLWEGYKSELTMPVRVARIKPEVVTEIWDSRLRFIEIETADEVSKTLEDRIVIDENQARWLIKRLKAII
jgi:hypothetical protein